MPRHRPPYVAQVGLFGRPTLEQNVETMYWIRDIVEKGAEWFTSQGRRERKGFRSFSVSGRVNAPGVVLAPAGVTARELIEEYCGGMQDGEVFKAYLPGGASGGILPASMADEPLDFGTLEKYGCFVGSHAVVILSEKDDMKAVALNLLKFFEDESCGQCTPCRVGTEKAVKLMETGPWDAALLTELSDLMRDASICGLGQAAPNPLLCVLKYFPDELDQAAGTLVMMKTSDTCTLSSPRKRGTLTRAESSAHARARHTTRYARSAGTTAERLRHERHDQETQHVLHGRQGDRHPRG